VTRTGSWLRFAPPCDGDDVRPSTNLSPTRIDPFGNRIRFNENLNPENNA
jgi:hypothetical protein